MRHKNKNVPETWKFRADYNAKAPPRATPAMAMTAVRSGSCSATIGAALDLLEVGEDADEAPVAEPVGAAADEAGSYRDKSQRNEP